MEMQTNKYQTPIESLNINEQPQEIQEQFWDFISSVPYIRLLISPSRPTAKELKKDQDGKIIVDITQPHILENMDYFRPSAIHFQKYGCYTNLKPNANPNSEYGKWIREEIRRCYEGYIRKSDGEWITGDMYFFLNYCPIQLIKHDKKGNTIRTIDFPKVWDGHYYKSHYLNQCRLEGHHAMELASRGRGKAHPYSQKVLTPFGWKLWQDIKLGDYLYGDDGNLTKVIAIPYDQESDIYTITLRDGRRIQCTDGHLFKVKNHKAGKIQIKSLKEIMIDYKSPRKITDRCPKGIEYNYRIPKGQAIYFPHNRVEVDAYTLGLLIGDGCFRTTSNKNYVLFTCQKEDFELYDSVIPYAIDKVTNDNYTYAIRMPNDYLKKVKLWYLKSEFKFIPKDYLYNSKEIRLEVLRGLMDADGTVDKTSGIPIFNTTSKQLKDDVEFLCRSLGYNVSTSTHESKFAGKIYNPHYRIRIITNDNIFKLPRKLKLLTKFSSGYSRSTRDYTAIVNIEYSHKEMAKCVTVDNESNCYLIGDFVVTHNSYFAAALLAKRFILGESSEVNKKVQCVATASERKYIQGANQLLDMFQYYIDHCAKYTQFPSKRLTSSIQNMAWTMGYLDVDTGVRRGTENSVIGITSKDDESKLRGSRGVLYLLEEAGSFPRLLKLYSVLRPSVEDGNSVWGLIYGYGTSGDSESDFSSMQELMYNPKGYNIKGVKNIYDKEGQGRKLFTYFFPGYLNMANCYDKDGNSDVIKSLFNILIDRYTVKYNSTDISAITKRIAEIPITPQEAILRAQGNKFPVTQLSERLNQLDSDDNAYDDIYIGNLVLDKDNQVKFIPTNDMPIRDFPLKDNKAKGAIEIYNMPEKNNNGKVFPYRYILGLDPVATDDADSVSLMSVFVLDLWTDRIVAEYTGRQVYADDGYEIVRLMCMFYNGKCLYESNIKGPFAYFSKMNSIHLLADTPEYLRDKQLIKYSAFGSNAKGVNASLAINNFEDQLIKDWLLKPITVTKNTDEEEQETTIYNLYFLRNRALIKELILYNPDINVDRVRALGLLMLYREEKMILYQGNPSRDKDEIPSDYLGNDPFFNRNYEERKLGFSY